MTVLQITLSETVAPTAPDFRVEVKNPFLLPSSWKVLDEDVDKSPLVVNSGSVNDNGGNLSLNLDAPVLILFGANWGLALGATGSASCELCTGVGSDWTWRVTAVS